MKNVLLHNLGEVHAYGSPSHLQLGHKTHAATPAHAMTCYVVTAWLCTLQGCAANCVLRYASSLHQSSLWILQPGASPTVLAQRFLLTT